MGRLILRSSVEAAAFVPLQHFSMDDYTTGQAVVVSGEVHTSLGLGYGSSVVTAQHRPSKSKSLRLSIQAGTSGFPADGETPAGNGLWGGQFWPPASQGSTHYGGQGDWFHFGMWMYVPTGFTPETNLNDNALKFLLHGCPDTGGTTGKDDVHICASGEGFAFINEWDPNAGTNNNYPSDRAGTELGFLRDQWFWFERATKLHSDGDQSITRIWINDVLQLERAARVIKWRTTDDQYHTTTLGTVGNPTLPTSSANIEFVYLFSYWNNHPSTDQEMWIDDITTAVSQAGMTTDAFGNPMMGSGAVP